MTLVEPFSAQISSHYDVFPFYGMINTKRGNKLLNPHNIKSFSLKSEQTARIIV